MKRGRKEGRQEERVKIILTMHDNDFTPEQIALATEKSEEEIRAIIREKRPVRS